jgi:hypothetical protein
LKHFDFNDIFCEDVLSYRLLSISLNLGFRLQSFQKTGNSEQQEKELKSVVRYQCCVGWNQWKTDVQNMVRDENY